MPTQRKPKPATQTPKERNLQTAAMHQRQVIRQITIPVVIGCVLTLALSVLAVVATSADEASRWADISLIWLIIPSLIGSILCMLVFAGLAYLTIRLIATLPFQFLRIQTGFNTMRDGVQKINERLTAPLIKFGSFKASTRTAGASLVRLFKPAGQREATPRSSRAQPSNPS